MTQPRALEGTHVLLLDGWQHRREPGHWQGWLAERLAERGAVADYLTLPDPERPDYAAWSAAALRALDRHPDAVVVAHGLSVLLWLRMCGDAAEAGALPLARRVVLVAPPATGMHGGSVSDALPASVTPEAVAAAAAAGTLLVFSLGDPYLPEGAQLAYGEPLRLPSVEIAGGAHLNQAAGFGPWPAMLEWCETGVWPAPAALEAELDALFHPEGRRLGMVVAGPVTTETLATVGRVLERQGIEPSRRRAVLQPRPGEPEVRAADVADFGSRYGHEYSVAVLAPALATAPETVASLETAFAGQGCAVVWSA